MSAAIPAEVLERIARIIVAGWRRSQAEANNKHTVERPTPAPVKG